MFWLALLLALGTAVAIAYPLFRLRSRAITAPADDPAASELAAAKESTYAAIKELEFDYRAGSLSPEDYQDLETKYKRKAASLLQAEDAHQSAAQQQAKIEAEVRRLRVQATGASAIEEEIRRLRASLPPPSALKADSHPGALRRFCTQCGSAADPEDRFCAQCGHPTKSRS